MFVLLAFFCSCFPPDTLADVSIPGIDYTFTILLFHADGLVFPRLKPSLILNINGT